MYECIVVNVFCFELYVRNLNGLSLLDIDSYISLPYLQFWQSMKLCIGMESFPSNIS